EDGEFCVFVGPSGCGKSTLLRMIAGLEETTEGTIEIGGRDVTRVDPAQRGVAMVFQTYALYPHMTVEENMGFGLKMNGVPREEIKNKVDAAADILKLGPYMRRKPKALSGGQRQRVAIGRAIVRGPEVFLFDEPLSNLDAELRVEMRVEIARLHREIGATMIYVTHDQVEAMTLADKIVVLRSGNLEQVGSPIDLYKTPQNRFVAGFIGSPAMNLLSGHVGDAVTAEGLGPLSVAANLRRGDVTVGVRPKSLGLDRSSETHTVDIVERLGDTTHVHLSSDDGARLVVEIDGDDPVSPAARIGVSVPADGLHFFDAESGMRVA
ncbi:MAG: sn-glycerol-3-phosphate ABC transporter ATP-binding protein UgpC, partial [Pseudomonadota bacterium]